MVCIYLLAWSLISAMSCGWKEVKWNEVCLAYRKISRCYDLRQCHHIASRLQLGLVQWSWMRYNAALCNHNHSDVALLVYQWCTGLFIARTAKIWSRASNELQASSVSSMLHYLGCFKCQNRILPDVTQRSGFNTFCTIWIRQPNYEYSSRQQSLPRQRDFTPADYFSGH